MSAPVSWYASPTRCTRTTATHDRVAVGAEALLRMLQDADKALTRRNVAFGAGKKRDEPDLRIYVESSSTLLYDERHGANIRALTKKLTRDGFPLGIRLELGW